jgi:hypothetical protein
MKRILIFLALVAMAQSALAEEKSVPKKIGESVKKGGEIVGHGIEKGADATVKGVKKAGGWVGKKMEKGGEKLEKATK